MNTALAIKPIKPINPIKVILPVWFALALAGSVLGVFHSRQGPPILVGAAALLPLAIFVILYLRSPEFRQFLLRADLRVLTLVQTWRVAGILFVILYYRGVLPGTFALPAGWEILRLASPRRWSRGPSRRGRSSRNARLSGGM
jgi:hypothetical protein